VVLLLLLHFLLLLLLRHLLLPVLDAIRRVGGWSQYQQDWYLVVAEWSWTMRQLARQWK